ncbi:hypothetical protein GAGA_4310 [Paraglaciecola agarilytica NO2]|uniref:Transposase n=1 Tax=Paraglaciecola agarilytica NO2 TaxID=1125747 RepID=A0ABQ0ICW4_9ALTE|nr:hypothetical protein GAGA_4310 [Paraglaciecola agarilytica NO2]
MVFNLKMFTGLLLKAPKKKRKAVLSMKNNEIRPHHLKNGHSRE